MSPGASAKARIAPMAISAMEEPILMSCSSHFRPARERVITELRRYRKHTSQFATHERLCPSLFAYHAGRTGHRSVPETRREPRDGLLGSGWRTKNFSLPARVGNVSTRLEPSRHACHVTYQWDEARGDFAQTLEYRRWNGHDLDVLAVRLAMFL